MKKRKRCETATDGELERLTAASPDRRRTEPPCTSLALTAAHGWQVAAATALALPKLPTPS